MRARLLGAALVLVALVALLARGTGGGAAWTPLAPGPAAPRPQPPRASAPRPAVTPWEPSRNLFEYADSPRMPLPAVTAPALAVRPRASEAPPAIVATPPPLRVVGLVRRGGELKAAFMLEGEMVLAGKGERAGGYSVLDVDEEKGVSVRGPRGEEMLLPPPGF